MVELLGVFLALTALKVLSAGGLFYWRYHPARRAQKQNSVNCKSPDSSIVESQSPSSTSLSSRSGDEAKVITAIQTGQKIRNLKMSSKKGHLPRRNLNSETDITKEVCINES